MKKTMKTKVFASLIAAVCAISAITTVSVISASAYNDNNPLVSSTYIITAKTYGNTFVMPMKGEDWTYYADSLNVKVSCDYDYSTNTCNFKFTAVKPGTANAVLKAQTKDGKWMNIPVCITVDDNMQVSFYQSGDTYMTA